MHATRARTDTGIATATTTAGEPEEGRGGRMILGISEGEKRPGDARAGAGEGEKH